MAWKLEKNQQKPAANYPKSKICLSREQKDEPKWLEHLHRKRKVLESQTECPSRDSLVIYP